MAEKINVAIVDDHIPFREGLVALFEKKYGDLKVLFEAGNGLEVMEKLKAQTPDVILMDLEMGQMNGEEAYDLICQRYPDINVIILTGHFNDSFVVRFVKKHVPAILSKTIPTSKIVEAIRQVHLNGHYFDDAVSEIMAGAIADSANETDTKDRPDINFNFQEIQVLKLMCLGYTTKQIADKTHRAKRTVDSNRNSIWSKTNIKSKAIPELIMFGLKHKILSVM